MPARTTKRRFGGALGVFTVLLTLGLGTYGAIAGYVVDASTAVSTTATILTAAIVIAFVAILSALGSRSGGWVHTPYW